MTEPREHAWLSRIRAWFRDGFKPVPMPAIDWTLMRMAFAALLLVSFSDWHPYEFAAQSQPVGVARWMNLTWLHQEGMHAIVFAFAALCCLAYVFGFALRLVLPLLTAAHVMVFTYQNSQGFIYHGVQLISMVLLVQTIVVWWASKLPVEERRARLWYYSRGIILFSYCASALNKIISSRGLWVWQSKYLCIEMVKTQRYDYYKDLDPALAGDPASALWLMQHPFAAQVIFGAGFFVETLAFLGLRDRIWSALLGMTIIAFHRSVSSLMNLDFQNHEWLCLIFLVNLPGWLLLYWKKRQAPSLACPPENFSNCPLPSVY